MKAAHCAYIVRTVVYAQHLLSSWESRTLVHIGRGCLLNQFSMKILGSGSLRSFPGWCMSWAVTGKTQCILRDSTWRGLLEACACFPLDFAHVPFPCTDFALYMFFVISDSHEYDCILRAMTPPTESPELGGVRGRGECGGVILRISNTAQKYNFLKKKKSKTKCLITEDLLTI